MIIENRWQLKNFYFETYFEKTPLKMNPIASSNDIKPLFAIKALFAIKVC